MSPLTTTILLALASTAAAKGGRGGGGGGGKGGLGNINSEYIVPISTAITVIGLLVLLFKFFKLRKSAPMFWCIILVFVAQVINFFTGLSTAVDKFGDKLPVTWGIADAFATFFLLGGTILIFCTVQQALFNEKQMKLVGKIVVGVWQFLMWFGAGYVLSMVIRYSMAWKKIHDFLTKNEDKANTPALDKEYKDLWDSYMKWNSRMRDAMIGVNGGLLAICIILVVLTFVRRKVLTKKERVFFPFVVLGARLVSMLCTVALQASFLWKGGEWSSKGFTITVWVVTAFSWLVALGGYASLIKSYQAIVDPNSQKASGKSLDDEEAAESLTGETKGHTVYPQGSNAVVGGEYGYAAMPASHADAPYPTYAPTDTRYSRSSYEAPEGHVQEKFGKKGKKAKKVELVGKATLDRIGQIIPVRH